MTKIPAALVTAPSLGTVEGKGISGASDLVEHPLDESHWIASVIWYTSKLNDIEAIYSTYDSLIVTVQKR
jgi:hypothetical protein